MSGIFIVFNGRDPHMLFILLLLQLLRDVRVFKRALMREENRVDTVVLATKLMYAGYQATVRHAIGGGPACFRNLRHEFLCVRGDGDYKGADYIVDPNFKEHFQIPHPTPAYEQVLACCSDEFVGTASRLIPLVQCLCTEIANSFEAKGLTLPPWRRAQAMLSKWLPVKSRDVSYNHSSDSEGASPDTESRFNRISEGQLACLISQRSGNKSLLSGKLLDRTLNDSVSVQPPVHWGQPPTYRVKMGAAGFNPLAHP